MAHVCQVTTNARWQGTAFPTPTPNLQQVLVEEHLCLVDAAYRNPGAQDAAAQSCVGGGFGSMRHMAFVLLNGGRTLPLPDEEAPTWVKAAQQNAKFWLKLAMTRCSRVGSAEDCKQILNLTDDSVQPCADTSSLYSSAQQENFMKLTLEIRPAEGGDDARLLVHDQASLYTKFAARHGVKARVEARGYL